MSEPNNIESAGVSLAASLIRHAMTAAAGGLGALGALNTDQQTQFVAVGTALALYVLAQAWSFIQKRTAKKA